MSFWLGGWRFTHCVLLASLPFRFGVWRRLGELLSGRDKADEDWSAKEGMAMGEMKGLLSSSGHSTAFIPSDLGVVGWQS